MNKLQALELAVGLSGLITGMETDLIQNIAAYLLAGKIDTEVSKWKIRKLAELGKLNQKNIETISSYADSEKSLAELTIKRAVISAMTGTEKGFRRMVIDNLVTDAPSGSMDKTTEAIIKLLQKQAKTDLNLVNTTMIYKAKDAAGKVIRSAAELANKQEYLDMLGKAAGKTVTSTEALTSAVSKCLKEMAEKGLPGFIDKKGREWSPEAYVNMCVRATVKNTASRAVFDRMKDFGLHIIEISSHPGARPKCAKDQGKLYDLNNGSGYVKDGNGKKIRYLPWSSTSYGEPDGILGINCGHNGYPFTAGLSLQRYFPYDEEENDKLYMKIQKQRELERKVRASKRACSVLKDGDPEHFKKASVQLKQRSQALKDYCDANGLMYQNERTSVLGFGRSEAGRVTAAYRKALWEEEQKLRQLELDNSNKRAILEEKIASGEFPLTVKEGKQKNHMADTRLSKRSYLLISQDELSEIVNNKHGTGRINIHTDKKTGVSQIRETLEIDKVVGMNVNNKTGVETSTNRIKIHYSKEGYHAVPTLEGAKIND